MTFRLSFILFLLLLLSGNLSLHAQINDSLNAKRLSEVEISAYVRPSTSRSTSPLQIIDDTEIKRIGILSVSDAVRRFSGVTVKDYGGIGGMKTVSIRGMGAQHTAVSYDGVTMSNVQSGQIDISRFSLDNISVISLSIGQPDDIFQPARSYVSAGLLQISTLNPIFTDKIYKLNIEAKTGSFGLFNPYLYYAQKLSKKFSLSANGSWERADGRYKFEYGNADKIEERKRKNSDINAWRTEVNLYGNLGRGGEIRFKTNYYDSERGLPGSVVFYNEDSFERVHNKDLFSQLYYKYKVNEKFDVKAQARFSRYYYQYSNYIVPQDSARITQFEYYASLGTLYKATENLSISFVEDIFQNRLTSNFSDVNKPRRNSSLTALSAMFNTNRLTITGNLLATYVDESIESGEAPDNKKNITPAISASFQPLSRTNIRVRASYKKIFRVPTFEDMYYIRMGNKDLKPEYATQYNVGITWTGRISNTFDFINISADGYKNKVDDKIVAFPTGNIFKMRNFGKVDMAGLDINMRSRIIVDNNMGIDISGNYSYQKVIDVTNEEAKNYKHQIPYTPRHYGSGAVSFENPWINIAYSLIVSGKRYALDQNIPENEIKAYTDHSVSLNKTFAFNDKSLRLQFNLSNLGNKNYQIIQYYPMPGCSFTLSANLSF